jgi:ABC-type uncharacterized transport system permease subunit
MKHHKQMTTSTILGIGRILLSLASIAGLYYLTTFAFNAQSVSDKTCISILEPWQLNVAKVTVVLLWVEFVLGLLGAASAYSEAKEAVDHSGDTGEPNRRRRR